MTAAIGHDQPDVFAFLQDPRTHGCTEPVIRIDTHGAALFLAGPDVYKVKRNVRFPFMDFSTLARRRAACAAEIAVNRSNAPGLYLGTVPITRDGTGLHLGGTGEVVEWAVHLRRFDETATLDRLAANGPLGAPLIDKLAEAVVTAHRRAPIRDGAVATAVLRQLLVKTVEELSDATELFAPSRIASYGAALIAAFDRVEPLLLRRGRQGQVRHCHGDLHLGNLVLIQGEPVLFDAIEFDAAIATCDTLYDLAFLVMDLCERRRRTDSNRLLNRYIALSEAKAEQIEGLAALPMFLSLRAAIRAKVMAAQHPAQALGYFEAARRFIAPEPPMLVAIGGLSGAGKTSLAAAVAPHLGRAPGALHLRSDVDRKRLFGVAETVTLPDQAYRPDISAMIHHILIDEAACALGVGQAVILDATHQQSEARSAIAALAARTGVPFFGFWLEAPIDLLIERVANRCQDASDATTDVVAAQAGKIVGAMTWQRLDASRSIELLVADALRFIEEGRNRSG
jgi:aminoglycoside phosphotransferase family enzyme/predicted kinase